jgi:hypothetical protein
MAIKTLAVCGCSWSAVSRLPRFKNTHWSELVSTRLNLDLHNLAIPGSSNFVIRLQIDKAIELNSDFIIITPSSPDRIEITNKSIKEPDIINYNDVDNYNSTSNNRYLRSSPIWDFVDKKIPGVENYVKNLYSSTVKKQIDHWIIRDGIHQLNLKNIPYLIQPQLLWQSQFDTLDFLKGIVVTRNLIDNEKCIFYNRTGSIDIDPGYHTTLEDQKNFSDRLQILIKEAIIHT